MSAILFISHIDDPEVWRPMVERDFPGFDYRVWPEVGDPAEVRYALVWKPEDGFLAGLPNLKGVLALGAGVDQLLADPDFPKAVPLVRLVEGAGMAEQMSEYCLYGVLHFHRRMDLYNDQQRRRIWRMEKPVLPGQRRVGVLGLGVLGGDLARKLALMGFQVRGWRRSPGVMEGIEVFHGAAALDDFLSGCEILVNLLPLTAETRGILSAKTFARLPRGARMINAGRGGHLIEPDLLAALESGQIAGALLDVFQSEPLAEDHPFWDHPAVTVTPHISVQPVDELALGQIAASIRALESGEQPTGLVDPQAGY